MAVSRDIKPPRTTRQSSGFTLIELLAVVSILVVIAGMVAVNLGNDPHRLLESSAKRFVGQLELISEEAAMRGIEFGLFIDEDEGAYQFLVYENNGWVVSPIPEYAKAIKVSEHLNIKIELTDTLEVNMLEGNNTLIDNEQNSLGEDTIFPQVAILSSGEFTPFKFTLEIEDQSEILVINVDMQGKHELIREIDYS